MNGQNDLPKFFGSNLVLSETTYPSAKNIKRLFARLGIDDLFARLDKRCKRDMALTIDSFQSLRTALAHESPPNVTIIDVKLHFESMRLLTKALDRVAFNHRRAVARQDAQARQAATVDRHRAAGGRLGVGAAT
jgi:hypothetical protein